MRTLTPLIFAALTFISVREAQAATCTALPNPIVIESGDTQEPLLKELGRKLRDSTNPMTILYRTAGTCTVTKDLYEKKKVLQNAVLSYIPSTAENPNWKSSDAAETCTVEPADGVDIDLGIGATFISSCNKNPPPAGIGLITGPVQGYGFIVPKQSTQKALTAEEGYFVFGFRSQGGAQPWTIDDLIFTRPATKSTALTLAAAIGIDPMTKLQGVPLEGSKDVLGAVIKAGTGPTAENAIGLMGTEIFDANRESVNLLAFRAFKQKYAYFPDSSPSSFDKRNVRDGHYLPWAPTVYIAPIDGAGQPSVPRTKRLVDLVLGESPSTEDVDGLASVVNKGLVPYCAMKVKREFDGANLSLYDAPEPCGCYFDAKVPNGSTSCARCDGNDGACGGGKCRHGYCEAK